MSGGRTGTPPRVPVQSPRPWNTPWPETTLAPRVSCLKTRAPAAARLAPETVASRYSCGNGPGPKPVRTSVFSFNGGNLTNRPTSCRTAPSCSALHQKVLPAPGMPVTR